MALSFTQHNAKLSCRLEKSIPLHESRGVSPSGSRHSYRCKRQENMEA